MTTPLRLGVLISGGGTTMVNLIRQIEKGSLPARICRVISSSKKAGGIAKAQALNLPVSVISRRKFPSDEAFSQEINQQLQTDQVDLVVLAGFLKRYLPGDTFRNKAINIHPSLIPAFCGQGFYGMNVHKAVYQRGVRVSGCTVHYVNEIYDEGPIILQKHVLLDAADQPETIRRKVFDAECQALPEAITLIAQNRVRIEGGRTLILPGT